MSALSNLDPETQPAVVRIDRYQDWRKCEGAPLVGGVYIKDMKSVEVGPWPRKGDGVKGALCYLDGDDEGDEHIVELPPGGSTAPLRHLYTEAIYVVSGHGSTSVWRDQGTKQTFEWGPGSYFVLPTNALHQFFNASLSPICRNSCASGPAKILFSTIPTTLQIATPVARITSQPRPSSTKEEFGKLISSRTSRNCRSTNGKAGAAEGQTRLW